MHIFNAVKPWRGQWKMFNFERCPMPNAYFERREARMGTMKHVHFWRMSNAKCIFWAPSSAAGDTETCSFLKDASSEMHILNDVKCCWRYGKMCKFVRCLKRNVYFDRRRAPPRTCKNVHFWRMSHTKCTFPTPPDCPQTVQFWALWGGIGPLQNVCFCMMSHAKWKFRIRPWCHAGIQEYEFLENVSCEMLIRRGTGSLKGGAKHAHFVMMPQAICIFSKQ